MTPKNVNTEKLIYWGVQHDFGDKIAYVFKRDYHTQDQILIVFYGIGNCLNPNHGSIMEVSYYLDEDGTYHGIRMNATDPGAYE